MSDAAISNICLAVMICAYTHTYFKTNKNKTRN